MNARIVLLLALLPLAACNVRAQDDAGAASAATEQSDELTRSVRAVAALRTSSN